MRKAKRWSFSRDSWNWPVIVGEVREKKKWRKKKRKKKKKLAMPSIVG